MDESKLEGLKGKLPAAPGINGKEEYFSSAVLVLLILLNGEYHFVFEKRAALIRQAGEICFPGGRFEAGKDKSYRETAVRETAEELGIPADRIRVLGPLDTVISMPGATVDAFLGILDLENLADVKINFAEVERIFTVPVSYFEKTEPKVYYAHMQAHPTYINKAGEEIVTFPAREFGLPERYYQPWGNTRTSIFVFQVEGETIWGVTARLVLDVVRKLRDL